jgi:hypothetical protein
LAAGPANAFDQLKNWPGYQFMYDQGLQGINRQLAAGGKYVSGAQIKDAQTFGQNSALANAIAPYISNLQFMSSLGANSAAQAGQIGAGVGRDIAGSMAAQGNVNASGITGNNGAWQNILGQVGSILGNGNGGYATQGSNGTWNPGPQGFPETTPPYFPQQSGAISYTDPYAGRV